MRISSGLVSALVLLAACEPLPTGEEPIAEAAPETKPAACDTLNVELLDQAVAPPANVAALVRITDCDGNPLGDQLSGRAFELSENGEVLSAFEAARSVELADRQMAQKTVIVLDMSGSIVRQGAKEIMVKGAKELALALLPHHQVAVFGFDGRPDLVRFSYFTDNAEELAAAFDDVLAAETVDDSTNLHGAIVGALKLLDNAVKVDEQDQYTVAKGTLVVFTDGRDRAGRVSNSQVDHAVTRTDHAIFTLGLGGELDQESLRRFGKTDSFFTDDHAGVIDAFLDVAESLQARAQTDYLISYCSPARARSRTLGISVATDSLSGFVDISFDADGFGAGCAPEDSPLR